MKALPLLTAADVYTLPQSTIWPAASSAKSARQAKMKANAAKVRKAFGIK